LSSSGSFNCRQPGDLIVAEQWRDLTRLRVKLVQEFNRVHNRIHKVLEDACIKLDTVASDILGVSGRAMIDGIVAGHEDVTWLADKAKSHLKKKYAQLKVVLRGRVTPHHRWMLGELMEELRFVEKRTLLVDQRICEAMQPHEDAIRRLCTIPGVGVITAWTLLAELGTDMRVFPDGDHAASWSGLCPGNYRSAGKRLSNRTRKGNRWLRRALCQSAWAASRKKDCFLAAYFYRQAARKGERKAVVATAHKILVIAYHVMRDGGEYRELGGNYYDQLHPERTRNRLVRRLERMGLEVQVRPAEQSVQTS
jgi:transposase